MGSSQDELTDIPQGLRNLALTENLSEEEVRMLAQITYWGHHPDAVDDWKFLYEPSNAV
ncbi:MAG TPA: hypothetical protein VF043_18865 [Ktedonobacteraceae bacterium]